MSVFLVAETEDDVGHEDHEDHPPLYVAYWDMQEAFNAARQQAEFTGRAARVFKLTEIGVYKGGAKK